MQAFKHKSNSGSTSHNLFFPWKFNSWLLWEVCEVSELQSHCRLENTWYKLIFFLIYITILFSFISMWNAKASSLSICWKHIALSFQRLHCIMHITHKICFIYIFFANQCFERALIRVHTVGLNSEQETSAFQKCSFTDIILISNSNAVTTHSEQSLPTCHSQRKKKIKSHSTSFFSRPQCLFLHWAWIFNCK